MRFGKTIAALIVAGSFATAGAQFTHGPRGDGPRDGDGPPMNGGPTDRGPEDGPQGRGGPDRGPMGRGGPEGREGPDRGPMGRGGPEGRDGPEGPMGRAARPMGAMLMYMDMVDRYTKLSTDDSAARISAVISLTDTLRPKGPQAVIDELTKLLPQVKDESVARAIRLQLVDFYRVSQQQDKAVEQAEALITGRAVPTSQPTESSPQR